MKFSLLSVLAFESIAGNSDAFLAPTSKVRTGKFSTTAMGLAGSSEDAEEEVNESGGSTRFQEMMNAAQKQAGDADSFRRPIENPFLNTPPPQASANPDDLSVEEQARMFREMMSGKQQQASYTEDIAPPPQRVARTDRAGRPIGRNRDADTIANTADLYFAQLKRDSSVRAIGRIRGDTEVSEAVFADEGIKELDKMLQKNPHLQAEEKVKFHEAIPKDLFSPYSEEKEAKEVNQGTSISYKQKLMERRQKKLGGNLPANVSSPEAHKKDIVEEPTVETMTPPPSLPEPERVVTQASTIQSLPPQQEQSGQSYAAETTKPTSVPTNPEEAIRKIRTLMGLMLKHRGGPGFGSGRLKGPEIERFEGLLEEITNILREESRLAQPVGKPLISTVAPATSTSALVEPVPIPTVATVSDPQPPPAAGTSVEDGSIDNTIACIEGAIAMYKNSPPSIRQSVIVTLRAALISAVDTCDIALASQSQPIPSITASPNTSIEGMMACIEGAVTMYKNSPPALKESVLITLRAALMSAVETCNISISSEQIAPHHPSFGSSEAAPSSSATSRTPVSQPNPTTATDPNSKSLEKTYEKVKAASGSGNLGLRSDLTAAEATELTDELLDMRSILMEELDSGNPDNVPVDTSQAWDNAIGQESAAASRYQQMLAKARAEKTK